MFGDSEAYKEMISILCYVQQAERLELYFGETISKMFVYIVGSTG